MNARNILTEVWTIYNQTLCNRKLAKTRKPSGFDWGRKQNEEPSNTSAMFYEFADTNRE